jgi:YegS/Rv2252/BmrU family lipid kinase
VVVFNPRAAGASGAAHDRLDRLLREAGLAFELVRAGRVEETREVARRAAAEGHVAVAAGGDGTANDVLNGVLSSGREDAALGLVPLGTGNDFARMLGLRSPAKGVRALASGRTRRVDVGRVVGGEYFLNTFGIGFDAEVVRRRSAGRSRWIGYVPTIVRTFLGYRCAVYEILWPDGRLDGPALLVTVMNGTTFGGGFRLAPGADPADGLLDVCRIEPVGLGRFARYALAVKRGTHGRLPVVRQWRTTELTVRGEPRLPYQLDGEYREGPANGELVVKVDPGKLRLMA